MSLHVSSTPVSAIPSSVSFNPVSCFRIVSPSWQVNSSLLSSIGARSSKFLSSSRMKSFLLVLEFLCCVCRIEELCCCPLVEEFAILNFSSWLAINIEN